MSACHRRRDKLHNNNWHDLLHMNQLLLITSSSQRTLFCVCVQLSPTARLPQKMGTEGPFSVTFCPGREEENIWHSHKALSTGRTCLLDSQMESQSSPPHPFLDTWKFSSPGYRQSTTRDSVTMALAQIINACLKPRSTDKQVPRWLLIIPQQKSARSDFSLLLDECLTGILSFQKQHICNHYKKFSNLMFLPSFWYIFGPSYLSWINVYECLVEPPFGKFQYSWKKSFWNGLTLHLCL